MRVLNVRAGQSWSYLKDKRRRAVVIGGTDHVIQVRVDGEPKTLSFRYFVRAYEPTFGKRYRYI